MVKRATAFILCIVVVALFCLIGGFIGGYFAKDPLAKSLGLTVKEHFQATREFLEEISAENIEAHLRVLAAKPHIAGSDRQLELAEYIKKTWLDQGLDEVELVPYTVLLSYPNKDSNNTASIVEADGTISLQSISIEDVPVVDKIDNITFAGVVQAYNAYSPTGSVEGEVVYANYGREEDFRFLKMQHIDVTDKIVIVRYGKGFRGNKVYEAAQAGAKGVILFSDPRDYGGPDDRLHYPDSKWLPQSGIQRGNIILYKGDPETQGYPSLDFSYRSLEDKQMPTIPCLPISFRDARKILKELGGVKAPEPWQGKPGTFSYQLGPSMSDGRKVRLEVNNRQERKTIYNVIGKIRGETEPDRLLVVGGHYDAWVYGASDPNSGTSSLLEVSRLLGKLKKENKRPRRTILFGCWDAEEFGLVGSYEWVEDNVKILQSRGVAYINVDTAVTDGIYFKGHASPLLETVMMDAMKKVSDPFKKSASLYANWRDSNSLLLGSDEKLRIPVPAGGSDFVPFIQHSGLPASTVKFQDKGFPLYHTAYETVKAVKLVDKDFALCRAIAQLTTDMVLNLANSKILPFDIRNYASRIHLSIDEMKVKYDQALTSQNIKTEFLESAAKNLTSAADKFHVELENNKDSDNPLVIRKFNDQLMYFERAFLDYQGIPGRPLFKHILLAPADRNIYSSSTFPGLDDLLFNAPIPGQADQVDWKAVAKHLSVLTFTIQAAAKTISIL